MARVKRWEAGEIKNGIGTITLFSWKYFMDYVYQEMLDYGSYVWRGHRRDDWKLESTIDRLAKKLGTRSFILQNTQLERFKFATQGRRGSNPYRIEDENEWWALGQHHGLATPLLDWTESPFAAAYFAFFEEGYEQTKYRAVYALHRHTTERKAREIKEHKEAENKERIETLDKDPKRLNLLAKSLYTAPVKAEVEFTRPHSDENQRLLSQGGLFTRSTNGPLEEWVNKNFEGHKRYTLMKLLIPNKDRELALRTLKKMNINHLTLFPDLHGASIYCNLHAEIKKY